MVFGRETRCRSHCPDPSGTTGSWWRATLILVGATFLVAACAPGAPDPVLPSSGTSTVEASSPSMAPTGANAEAGTTATPRPTSIPTATATEISTATPSAPTSGPGAVSAAMPANPAASDATRAVLAYLDGLADGATNRLVVGQNAGSLTSDPTFGTAAQMGYDRYIDALARETGTYVALAGADYGSSDRRFQPPGDLSAINGVMREHWERGGLVTLMFSARNPWTGSNHNDRERAGESLADLLVEGTPANIAWRAQLAGAAAGLRALRDQGVVVLWRPLHELNGSWFWWGFDLKADQAENQEIVLLWQDMFDYFTYEQGLDNLLWVYAVSAQTGPATASETALYPGDAYVDIVAFDLYEDSVGEVAVTAYERLQALGKPVAIAELGPSRGNRDGTLDYAALLAQIEQRLPRVCYILVWNDFTSQAGASYLSLLSNVNADRVLRDPWVVTADEVPRFNRSVR